MPLPSVADPDPRSGIRCLFDPWIRDPGFALGFFRILDSIILKIGPNFFLRHLKNKIIFNFVKIIATIKGITTNFFSPLSFVAVFGSGIRDPGSGIRDG